MKYNREELINFMMWYQSDTSHLNYDPVTAVDKFEKFINSSPNESPSVQHNEDQRKPCNCIWQCDSPPAEHLDRCKQFCQAEQGD